MGRKKGDRESALKGSATRLGVPLEELRARTSLGQRFCTGCRAWKPLGEFYSGFRGSTCNVCTAAYARALRARKRGLLRLEIDPAWEGGGGI